MKQDTSLDFLEYKLELELEQETKLILVLNP